MPFPEKKAMRRNHKAVFAKIRGFFDGIREMIKIKEVCEKRLYG